MIRVKRRRMPHAAKQAKGGDCERQEDFATDVPLDFHRRYNCHPFLVANDSRKYFISMELARHDSSRFRRDPQPCCESRVSAGRHNRQALCGIIRPGYQRYISNLQKPDVSRIRANPDWGSGPWEIGNCILGGSRLCNLDRQNVRNRRRTDVGSEIRRPMGRIQAEHTAVAVMRTSPLFSTRRFGTEPPSETSSTVTAPLPIPSSDKRYSTGRSTPAKSGNTDKVSQRTGSPTRTSGNATDMIGLLG